MTGDGLVRLNGDSSWERKTWSDRNDLAGNTRFLVYSRWLSMDATAEDKAIVLQRVAHVRSSRMNDGRVVVRPQQWAAPNLAQYRIPLRFAPVPGHTDMLIAAPTARLQPGLYSLSFRAPESWSSRFGVGWTHVAISQYKSRYCVDKLPQGFVPCQGPVTIAANTGNLSIRHLTSSRMDGNGPPRVVIVGDIVNTSTSEVSVPPFNVSLLGARHQVLQSLHDVNVNMPAMMPGRSYRFRIVVTNAATGATQVRVTPAA
ncbi:MAG: hypothetical protein KGK10_00395 [Rhodospirillales bacterium]|nr:hypothetical protein [Rhodospirillales bacterium]